MTKRKKISDLTLPTEAEVHEFADDCLTYVFRVMCVVVGLFVLFVIVVHAI